MLKKHALWACNHPAIAVAIASVMTVVPIIGVIINRTVASLLLTLAL